MSVSLTGWELIALLVSLGVVTAALIATAHLRPPSMVTLAVSLLTLALLAAWVADPGRADNLVPLIGVGVGALATALSNIFEPPKKDDTE